MLMQYKPFRQESELLQGFNSAKEAFLAYEEELKETNKYMEKYRQADAELENALTKAYAILLFETNDHMTQEEIGEEINCDGQGLMNDEQYQTAMQALNVKQKELLQIITNSIQAQIGGSNERFKIFLTGNAGCGKTFVMKSVQNQIIRLYGNKPETVKLAALTGVAAVLINGATLHSTFRLPVQKNGHTIRCEPLTGNVLRNMRVTWRPITVLIIDEISMVSYEMFSMIEGRCRQIKNNETEFFGGLNVLLCGDLLQLPPIRGYQVFDRPPWMSGQTDLWDLFTLCELVDNMRQKSDQTFINILNALRLGELKLNQLADLEKRIIRKDGMVGEFALGKALRICGKREYVDVHNALVLEEYQDNGQEVFTIKAQDRIIGGNPKLTEQQIKAKIPSDINNTGGMPATLSLFVDAKVMLRVNIDTSKKLVNGAIGNITEIIWPLHHRDQMYDKDIPRVKIQFEGGVGEHTIQPSTIEFPGNGCTAERYMLPLVLCWASTGHKMQGNTLDTLVANLTDLFNIKGLAYVILSRVRSLAGLRIEALDAAELVGKKPCNVAAKEKMAKMRKKQQEKN